MKKLLQNCKYSWFLIFCLAIILVIVACNFWLLCFDRYVLSDYLKIPVIGWLLIIANLVAGLILFSVKRRNDTSFGGLFCRGCQAVLRDTWVYCPNCGGDRCP